MYYTYLCVFSSLQENIELIHECLFFQGSCGILTFVFESSSLSVVASHTEGLFNEAQYEEALTKCRMAASYIFKYYREVIKKYAPKL